MKSHLLFRTTARLHAALDIALAAAIAMLLVYGASKHDRQFSIGDNPQPLSERAREMVVNLNGSVDCTVVLPLNHAFHERIRQLLLNMKDAAKDVDFKIEFIDPHSDIARAAETLRRAGTDDCCVIFERDNRRETIEFEKLLETVEIDSDTLFTGSRAHKRFRGEQLCVTALARLARPTAPVLYALSGHGERDFSNYDALGGYSDLAREIRREGYEIRPLSLTSTASVPSDCDLLVIAGPTRPPAPSESDSICDYLSKGGRLLFLADRSESREGGWHAVAERVGVSFPGLTVIDGGTIGGYNVTIDFFSKHDIARDLAKNAVTFASPQVVDPADDSLRKFRLASDVIVKGTSKSWGETEPNIIPRIYDPGVDRKGNLPVAVATWVDGSDELGLKFMRAVIVGDSAVGSNAFLAGGGAANRDFILNAIEWLTESDMPSSPSIAGEGDALRLNLTRRRQIRFWVNGVIIWPSSVCLFGLFVSLTRRLF